MFNKIDFNKVFDDCVNILIYLSKQTHTTYKEINVIIFCIIEPIVFFGMLYMILKQRNQLNNLKINK